MIIVAVGLVLGWIIVEIVTYRHKERVYREIDKADEAYEDYEFEQRCDYYGTSDGKPPRDE